MEEKTKNILKSCAELSRSERDQLVSAIQQSERVALSENRTFSEVLNRQVGPISGARCTQCGK